MPAHRPLTRRAVLGGLVAAPFIIGCARAQSLVLTPAQIEGPFYPAVPPPESDTDLTRIAGREAAKGPIIEVSGRVFDHRGKLVPGAIVELWQANAAGRYDHPQDGDTSGPLDHGFQGWGKAKAADDGRFRFRTIVPGTYLAARDWRRPPHLHFKIAAPTGAQVTTQTYFGGHPLNAKDGILQALSPAQQQRVVIDFKAALNGAQAGTVDFYLPPA